MSDLAQRNTVLTLLDEAVDNGSRLEPACAVLGISPSTVRGWRRPGSTTVEQDERPDAKRPAPTNRYSDVERDQMVATCNSSEFASLPPAQIVPQLADRGEYIGSESTLYRVLHERGQVNRRGRQRQPNPSPAPTTHAATAVSQVWMLDVTWLPSRVAGRFWYLYAVEDLYSRAIVHWEVFEQESSDHTERVVQQALWREKCVPAPPVLHTDNGSVMTSQTLVSKLHAMGITPSRSRPRVSNDNAYIESFFRTVKYSPSYPSQGFETVDDARKWVQRFVGWYNEKHRHSALRYVTPMQRHRGEDAALLAKRHALYQQARAENPHRWSGNTRNWSHQGTMTLNPEKLEKTSS